MLFIKFSLLAVALALCFVTGIGQASNWLGCFKKVVCDLTPYVSRCCQESFAGEMDYKKAMESCLKRVLYQELAVCINVPSADEHGGMEQQRSSSRIYDHFNTRPRQHIGFRSLSRRSAYNLTKRSKLRQFGSSAVPQSEDCKNIRTNLPNSTEDCPSWSQIAANCVNAIPLIAQFCQGPAFGGIDSGGFPTLDHGSFGGTRRQGFQFGLHGSSGGMGNKGFAFSGQEDSGGSVDTGLGWQPSFGGRKKLTPKTYYPAPGDQREYEEVP